MISLKNSDDEWSSLMNTLDTDTLLKEIMIINGCEIMKKYLVFCLYNFLFNYNRQSKFNVFSLSLSLPYLHVVLIISKIEEKRTKRMNG